MTDAVRRQVDAALDGPEDLGGPPVGEVPAVDPTGAAQLVRVAGRSLRDGEQPEVREHHAPGPVRLRRGAFAPGRHLLGDARGCGADMLRMSPSFHQASSGTRAGASVAEHLVALAEGPVEPAQRAAAAR